MQAKKVKMVLNRTAVLASTLGHIINFVKGVPFEVPVILLKEAAQMGAEPVDKDVDPFEETNEVKITQPVHPDERLEVILKTVREIADTNSTQDFTATGIPKVSAVMDMLNFKVDRTEVLKAWRQRAVELADAS